MSKVADAGRGEAGGTGLHVASVVTIDGHDEPTVFALAASIARGLEARFADALLQAARERTLPVPSVERLHDSTRAGVVGSVDGHTVVLGSAALFAALGLPLADLGDVAARLRRRREQLLFVAVDGCTAGVVGVAEAAIRRPDSRLGEDEMNASRPMIDEFSTATAGLPDSQPTDVIALADGAGFDLRIAPVAKPIGDATVRLLAYNGSVPGPTLRVRQGSELLVTVANDGDLETTVHWHGLRLDNRYDGTTDTQRPIPVGGRFTYRLSFPDPGVYWYHPHIREDYGQELGLYGTIVVEPRDAAYWPAADREVSLTLDDILLEHGQVAPFSLTQPTYTAMGRFGNVMLVNGAPDLSLEARPGEVVRFYLTNTANTRVFNVALPGARMKLVGGDSGRYEREVFVDGLVIAPSERAVVDVLFDRPGRVALEHRTPQRVYVLGAVEVRGDRVTGGAAARFDTLRVDPALAAMRVRLDGALTAAPDRTLSLVAEMEFGGTADGGDGAAYICPMHPEVTSHHADRCPKCGMKLVPAGLVHGGHGHHDAHAQDHSHGHDHGRAPFEAPAGIEWEDDMVEVNRLTTPDNMRWKLVDRLTGAEGTAIDWRFRVGDQVKIRLVNEMDSDHPMHHPFHVHGAGRFVVLSRDGVEESNRVWKDTVLVTTGQTVDLLFDVTQPGIWMAHCHIAEHHEAGMMLRFRVDPR